MNLYRYAVLAWDTYYPSPGLENVRHLSMTEEQADAAAIEFRRSWDHVQVVDLFEILACAEGETTERWR